jgi:hypothetical protein
MSHDNAYDKRTAARNGATFEIKWQYDDSPDLSYLGEYTDSPGEWQVDRKEGRLLGEYIENETEWMEEDATQIKADELEADGMEVNWNYDEREDGTTVTSLYYWGYEILAADLRTNYDHNSYRYFAPANMDVEAESKEDKIKYAIRDFERMEDANRGYWSPVGCIVTMYIEGEEVAYASLWGIESDSGDGYLKEVEEDLISECISDAKKNSAALAAHHMEVASKLTEYSGDSCPFCHGENIEGDRFEAEAGEVYQRVECADCGKVWHDIYKLTGYMILNEDKPAK